MGQAIVHKVDEAVFQIMPYPRVDRNTGTATSVFRCDK